MGKKPRGTYGEAWGILNPYGDIWTTTTFETEDAASAYVRHFWANFPGGARQNPHLFQPVRVKVHVTPLPTPPDVQQPGGVVAQARDN